MLKILFKRWEFDLVIKKLGCAKAIVRCEFYLETLKVSWKSDTVDKVKALFNKLERYFAMVQFGYANAIAKE